MLHVSSMTDGQNYRNRHIIKLYLKNFIIKY